MKRYLAPACAQIGDSTEPSNSKKKKENVREKRTIIKKKKKTDTEDGDGGDGPKEKRQCAFRPEYTEEWPFIVKSDREGSVFCTYCRCDLRIGSGGRTDID